MLDRAYLGGTLGHVASPLAPKTPSYPNGEGSFWIQRPKKCQRKIFMAGVPKKKINSQKRSTKIALGTGGALWTVRPLGVAPLDDFQNTPLMLNPCVVFIIPQTMGVDLKCHRMRSENVGRCQISESTPPVR